MPTAVPETTRTLSRSNVPALASSAVRPLLLDSRCGVLPPGLPMQLADLLLHLVFAPGKDLAFALVDPQPLHGTNPPEQSLWFVRGVVHEIPLRSRSDFLVGPDLSGILRVGGARLNRTIATPRKGWRSPSPSKASTPQPQMVRNLQRIEAGPRLGFGPKMTWPMGRRRTKGREHFEDICPPSCPPLFGCGRPFFAAFGGQGAIAIHRLPASRHDDKSAALLEVCDD